MKLKYNDDFLYEDQIPKNREEKKQMKLLAEKLEKLFEDIFVYCVWVKLDFSATETARFLGIKRQKVDYIIRRFYKKFLRHIFFR